MAAVVCLLATIGAPHAFAQQSCPTLMVSNNDDQVNGDTSSPCALIANPGSDGISLREAVAAANNATGSGIITITFAPSLAGQTIAPNSSNGCCYIISRAGITIAGFVGQAAQPAVTIDASNMFIVFSVLASDFRLTSMAITGLQAANPGDKLGVSVRAGEAPTSPQTVSNIIIQGNVFSNNPAVMAAGIPVSVGMNAQATGAVLSNVTIANNTFTNFLNQTDAVNVQLWGTNNTIQDVHILGNTFTKISFPIEIVPANSASGGRILDTQIVGNSFNSSQQPINLNMIGEDGQAATTNNVIDGTLIERNVFTGNTGPAIVLLGGLTVPTGNTVSATKNAITNTQIINNLVTGDSTFGAVSVAGGRAGSTQNSITGVRIVNNTFANYAGSNGDGGAISVNNNLQGGTSNTVSGVAVLNTILWNNTPADFDGVTASQVTTSITAQAGFAGVNGNIASNPQFVNSSSDFHLQSGSPARHAGTAAGAPAIDLDCQPRGSPPSIGAYEFAGPNICPAFGGTLQSDAHDFNGDGMSDILWRDTSGNVATWLMNGASVVQSAGVGNASASVWAIAGQRDFNGDGDADLLWRDSSGNIAMWFMNGATVSSSAGVGNAPTTWSIVGTGDFNGDGKGDILWHDTGGNVAMWLMNGASVAQSCGVGNAPTTWSIVGTGDFNGDGDTDILWRDSSGNVAIWFMNGCTVTQSSGVGNAPTIWSIAGTGDFDGDGMSDLLWHDNGGNVAIWLMNGAAVRQSSGVGNASPSVWSIAQTGDYNGDGKSDILWHDTSGNVAVWEMNGPAIVQSAGIGNASASVWTIQSLNAD